MRRLSAIICSVSLIILSIYAQADTIILKSGRQINSTKCWDSGDQIKCKIYGQVIGYQKSDIAEVHMGTAPVKPTEGFRYDFWQSGITVNEAIDIAEANDLPLHGDGLISANKNFNSKMCRPYAVPLINSITRIKYSENGPS